jgi:hypothetical protein
MRRQLRSLAIATALAVAALALLAGCGGGGGGKDLTEGLSAQEVLTRSAAEAAKVETFRIDLDLTGNIGLRSPSAIPGGSLLAGPLDISGEGPVELPDKASLDVTIKLSGLPVQANVTRVGDDVYLSALGQDFKVAVPASTVRLLSFGDLYPTLVDWTTDPSIAGREDLDGTPVVKVNGAVDPEKAFADLGPLLSAGDVGPAKARAALKRGTVEFWIGTEDLLPRRIHLVLRADASLLAEGLGLIDIDLSADLSDYDEPVDITAPANARPLDPGSLGSLFGG